MNSKTSVNWDNPSNDNGTEDIVLIDIRYNYIFFFKLVKEHHIIRVVVNMIDTVII
jgi:hypothetical protein